MPTFYASVSYKETEAVETDESGFAGKKKEPKTRVVDLTIICQ